MPFQTAERSEGQSDETLRGCRRSAPRRGAPERGTRCAGAFAHNLKSLKIKIWTCYNECEPPQYMSPYNEGDYRARVHVIQKALESAYRNGKYDPDVASIR